MSSHRLIKCSGEGDPSTGSGYTTGMKTAISLPDDLYAEGEAYAECHNLTRSRLYAAALREFLLRHNDDSITAAIDALFASHPDLNRQDLDLAEASRHALLRNDW